MLPGLSALEGHIFKTSGEPITAVGVWQRATHVTAAAQPAAVVVPSEIKVSVIQPSGLEEVMVPGLSAPPITSSGFPVAEFPCHI